ncbi:MAG TPA: hypothetical protein VHW64_11520 [Nocardioides sp.]|uniref:hypothetical protein n=1 Tax=Nocardioides sp. TaxID=35761 RepID=UPI002E2FF686|nr:hypothetical protein [Nocardioides sp.]HEX3931331.1 hypothetical protein [Nocardioides sp.]
MSSHAGWRAVRPVAAVAAALVLAGCGSSGSSTPNAGGGGSPGSSTGSSSGSSSGSAPSGGSSGQVQGVTLTPQGSALNVGQTARVTWQPQGKAVSVAALTVTRLQREPISVFSDWRLDRTTQHSTPYFVHATVRNLGNTNLGGATVPLYLLDQSNTLLQPSSFQASFPKCPSRPLPKLTKGRTTSVCLVYFVVHHGTMRAVSFRPSGDFKAITWAGHVGG